MGRETMLKETKRNHSAVVIELNRHLAQQTCFYRGDEGDQEDPLPEEIDIEEVLLRTTLRSRRTHNWTIDVGHSMSLAPGQNMSREKLGDTSRNSITPGKALTGQDPERFRPSPQVIEAAEFLRWSACEATSRLPSNRAAAL